MNEHYQAVLADLKQMKADAEFGIAAIERLMSRTAPEPATVEPRTAFKPMPAPEPGHDTGEEIDWGDGQIRPIKNVSANADSVAFRVVHFLNENPGKTFDAEEIAKAVNADNIKSLRGALSRLFKDKKIGRYGRGKYRGRLRATLDGQDESATT